MFETQELKPIEWTTLWWLTNNANVEFFLTKVSGKLRITRLVMEILRKGQELCFDVHPIWVSRDDPFLQKANCLSKGINSDNWSVADSDFSYLDKKFGPFSINLFATCENRKCDRFYSQSFEKGSAGTAAFAQKWEGEWVYAAPPITYVMRTIQKAANSCLNGAILVPCGRGPSFGPTRSARESI